MRSSHNIYSSKDLEGLKSAAKCLKEVLEHVTQSILPGTSSLDLNLKIKDLILSRGAIPLFKGYDGYPFESCISINDTIVHGYPDPLTVVKYGDIVSVDIGVKLGGYCADAARTVVVGFNPLGQEMVTLAERCYQSALRVCMPGKSTGDVGYAIQSEIAKVKAQSLVNKYKVFPHFQGHGIGRELHEPPSIPNFGFPGTGTLLEAGMCVCIEPVLVCKTAGVIKIESGYPNSVSMFKTSDGSPAVHYENQVYITHSGPIELTR